MGATAAQRMDDNSRAWISARRWISKIRTMKFVLVAELPGFDEDDVTIEVMDNRLILRGQKDLANEERGSNYYRLERGVTEFTRVIPLPPGIDADNARAKVKNGLLRIVLPKSENARAKRIEVQAS